MIETVERRYGAGADATRIVLNDPRNGLPLIFPADKAAEVVPLMHWHRLDAPRTLPTTVSDQTVSAQVNDSRWIVQCPGCNGAQVVSKADPRFFCVDCLNVKVGGSWLRVTWPDDPASIEAALLVRPDRSTRSWLPHETVGDLVHQNDEHGI